MKDRKIDGSKKERFVTSVCRILWERDVRKGWRTAEFIRKFRVEFTVEDSFGRDRRWFCPNSGGVK